MAMRFLRRLAAAAPACVFPAIGENGAGGVAALASLGHFRFVPSVRQAAILLVAGKVRKEDHEDLCRLHDQLPHPRRTLWWDSEPLDGFPDPVVVASIDEARDAIMALWPRLVSGEETSEPDLLPDKPAHPWRGKGDHGQGGEGMMGGKPYGRPMAMTGDDLRDGLALDLFTCEYGPLLPILPPGLKLELTLQGDVIQTASVRRPPYREKETDEEATAVRRRLLHLLGMPDMNPGRSGRSGRNISFALPRNLGTIGETDVRSRFGGKAVDVATGDLPRLVDLLPGLEWNEALLLINSLPASTLEPMCPVDRREEAGEGHAHEHGGPG